MGGRSRLWEKLKEVSFVSSRPELHKSQSLSHVSGSRHAQPITWSDIPTAVLAQALSCLSFQERCQCTLVCANWRAIIYSAAAHARDQSAVSAADSRALPFDVDATDEQKQLKLQQCMAIRYAPSAAVTLNEYAPGTMQHLTSLTRLVLIDPDVLRQQLDGEAFVHTPARPAVPVGLSQLSKLQVLSFAMCRPLLQVQDMPASLSALHLDLASGFSVKQLSGVCQSLADAAEHLPHLAHISFAMELDALLSSSQAAGLSPLAGLKQLTSLAFVGYQYMHPDSSAHEGYALVPPVLAELPSLQSLRLTVNSGHNVDLTPAAAVPEVNLVLTLAHYEQTPFNKLPTSITAVTGLTSLSLLMAEFAYVADRDMYIFDAQPLAALPKLQRLLLELHGVKSALHDLQGLADLTGLSELVVLLKCPDVHEARPNAKPASLSSYASGGAGCALLPEPAASVDSAGENGAGGGLLASLGVPSRLLSFFGKPAETHTGSLQHRHRHHRTGSTGSTGNGNGSNARALAAHVADSRGEQVGLVSEEWVLGLVDHALDQLKPEFALSVPVVSCKLVIATTNRLHLRQPENLTAARQPMLMASNLQLDLTNTGDAWGGESFLHPMGPSALRSWVGRFWAPQGLELLPARRYPLLGTYPGCAKRIDDKLSVAARRGVGGAAVVEAVMGTAEAQCMSYFC